jgi:hypothetical protein
MKTIYVTVDAEHIQYGQLAELVAHALHPLKDDATVAEMAANGATQMDWEARLFEAVRSGALPVKNPVTYLPHSLPMGHALQSAMVAVKDLCLFLDKNGIKVELEKPKYGTAKRWTAEELERLKDFRSSHTEAQTAEHFGVSGTTVRSKLRELKLKKTAPKTTPFSGIGKK